MGEIRIIKRNIHDSLEGNKNAPAKRIITNGNFSLYISARTRAILSPVREYSRNARLDSARENLPTLERMKSRMKNYTLRRLPTYLMHAMK